MKRIKDLPMGSAIDPAHDDVLVDTPDGTKRYRVGALNDDYYAGVDLTEVFAEEIRAFEGDPWAWIQDRCRRRDYHGLHVKDYIPWTLNGHLIESAILGIEPYLGATDVALAGHIDFVSRDAYPEYIQFNTSNVNQGNATNPNPYMVSNLKAKLDALANQLPNELKNVILNKRSLMESRYTNGQTLTSSTSWAWQDLGKLWALHETEIFGSFRRSGKWASGNGVKYPYFNDGREIVKHFGKNGSRCNYWECDVEDGSSTGACVVGYSGLAYTDGASYTSVAVLVCFRIGYNA